MISPSQKKQTENSISIIIEIPMWYDTHFHLDHQQPQLVSPILQHAREKGVTQFLLQTTSQENLQFVLDTAAHEEGVLAAVGQHPLDLDSFTGIEPFAEACKNPRVAAIGEIGLDYHYAPETAEKQKKVFALFLELAVQQQLPVVIHCREAFKDCYSLVTQYCPPGYPVIIHSFTGTLSEAALWSALNYTLSVNGMITFPKGDNIRQALSVIPLAQLILETDSPYLTPVPLRGTENTPANIPIIGAKVAELKCCPIDILAAITTDNANRLFKPRSVR